MCYRSLSFPISEKNAVLRSVFIFWQERVPHIFRPFQTNDLVSCKSYVEAFIGNWVLEKNVDRKVGNLTGCETAN